MTDGVVFTADQRRAVDAILDGKNVFLTGEGGTGKSFVLQHTIARLRDSGKVVAVCAPTGIAALNVGGCTLHRTFGLPMGVVADPDAFSSAKAAKVLHVVDTVVIDEVGMVRADMFDAVAAAIEHENWLRSLVKVPTGVRGLVPRDPVQLVVVGDFFQLPPVVTQEDRAVLEALRPGLAGKGFFAFETPRWADFSFESIVLREQKRQQDGSTHVRMLNLARVGDPACLPFFNARAGIEPPAEAVRLCTTNRAVNEVNQTKLAALDAEEFEFEAVVRGDASAIGVNAVPVEEKLVLKVGARVMTVTNDNKDFRYVNGTLGTVEKIDPVSRTVMVRPDPAKPGQPVEPFAVRPHVWYITEYDTDMADGRGTLCERELASFEQLPLRLAWAMTVHKSQGQTFESACIDPTPSEVLGVTDGLMYVALSRLKSAEGTYLTSRIEPEWLAASDDVVAFYQGIEA